LEVGTPTRPSATTMPRPMALIGITTKTIQILNDQSHKVDDKTKYYTTQKKEKDTQTHTSSLENS